jgi:cyclohexanecarboxyl-CoA dehydrogenase
MDFSISDEQKQLIDNATRFAREHIAPGYQARDREGRLDRALVRRMGELGFFGVELPERHGGLGLDCVTAGLLMEALCGDDMNIGYVSVNVSLIGQILSRFGRPEVVDEWIADMITGERLSSIALTEPGAGSDAANLALRARRDGEEFVLNGEKTSISLATQSDFTVLFARTGPADSRARGISAFLVPLDAPGITRTEFDDLGGRSVGRGSLFFDDARVPASHLLGEEDRAFVQVMQGFDYSRALIGLQCLAVARRSLEETWAYVREREAFGKPIASFQGVAFPLAEAETQMLGARMVCMKTLWLKDRGLPHSAEAAMAKWWAPKVAYDVVGTCLLTHGHGAYSSEMPYEQRLRDLLGMQIGDGTAQIMKLVIARSFAGRAAVPT